MGTGLDPALGAASSIPSLAVGVCGVSRNSGSGAAQEGTCPLVSCNVFIYSLSFLHREQGKKIYIYILEALF